MRALDQNRVAFAQKRPQRDGRFLGIERRHDLVVTQPRRHRAPRVGFGVRAHRDEKGEVLLRGKFTDLAVQLGRMLAQFAHRSEHGQTPGRAGKFTQAPSAPPSSNRDSHCRRR